MKTYITLLLCCCFTVFGFSQSITDIEYFYNTDPGIGNATQITANANTGNLTQTLSLPVPIALSGFNTLYVRTKDDANVWSLYDHRTFYIVEDILVGATNIAAAEYFINTDPGFGNADPIAINANTGNVTQTLSLPINDTNLIGFNTLYIRTQDDLGVWSLYEHKIFYISEDLTGTTATNIVAAEYFINTDPGFGNADPIAINANTGNVTQTLSLSLDTNLLGFNTLYIRTQDDLGIWSLYDTRLFYIYEEQIIAPIVAAEYFYDVDPGFGNGTAGTITPTGNPDEYTIDLSTNDVLPCDLHDFYIRLQNQDGTWSLYDYGVDVDVYDDADPTIVVFPNITVELDANGQAAPFTIADVNNGTFDDCELVSVVMNPVTANYTCANLGANTVTVTATDAEAKVSTQDVTITVVDLINPVAVSQNITVQLDANGNVSITPSQIENGSTDNCSITSSSLDITNFTCANLGANTVQFTVTDSSANSNTTSAIVTVEDSVNPTAITQNVTVQLDASGNVTITPDDVDLSTDNCSIVSNSLDITSFTCANLGANTVTLTVTDQSTNSNSATAIVTVEDSVNPTVVTQNITVQLDASGNASITPSQIENGSTDNCSISSSSLDITSFTCSDLGNNTVTLSVTDQSNNTGTTTAIVTVEDSVNPTAITQNLTVQLDASGNVTITPDDVDLSTDNCSIVSNSLDITSFTCANLGANTVTLTVTDQSTNSNSATAIVTVEDSVNPTVVTQNITVQLDASGNASITPSQIENGSTDNCSISSSSLDITSFTCSDVGNNTVTLSVTDQSNNTGATTAIVTVEDSVNPTVNGQDITINLGSQSSISITADDVDDGSFDNCGFTLSIDIDTFTEIGQFPVELTITDASGNQSSVTVIVTVINETLSIEEIEVDSKSITLYPIPAVDMLHISTNHQIDTIDLFDIAGKRLKQIKNPSMTINVSDLPTGMYFMNFYIESSIVTKKIIKQ